MAYDTKNVIRDAAGAPVPQYYSPANDKYEPVQGEGGKQHVRASEIEDLLGMLGTQATLAAVLAKLSADPSTAANQTALNTVLGVMAATAVTDPTASATVIALLKGVLKQLQTGPNLIQIIGSYVCLSTEPKPTEADGVGNGNDLLEVDTGKVFVFYKGEWRMQ